MYHFLVCVCVNCITKSKLALKNLHPLFSSRELEALFECPLSDLYVVWWQNLAHDGAFMPWRDPSCLDALPQQLEGSN